MGRTLVDLTGQRFGKLVVVLRADNIGRHPAWLCKCDCGAEIVVRADFLKTKATNCGCDYKGAVNKTHGMSYPRHRLYVIWANMKQRCHYTKCSHYPNYGGRGITVCQEWQDSFEAFYEWAMSSGYEDHLSIDRINCDGNYEPSNCRWATMKEQQNNRRNNKRKEG
jgi:hypothetical protein